MLIDKYIENALYLYQCVIIPGFGGFVATEGPKGEPDGDAGKYVLDKKCFAFNPLLKVNDGVLAMYIANMRDISYAEAMTEISRAVDFYLATLEKGDAVDIEGVGSVMPGENGLVFVPHGAKDFSREQYGLTSAVVPPEKCPEAESADMKYAHTAVSDASPVSPPQRTASQAEVAAADQEQGVETVKKAFAMVVDAATDAGIQDNGTENRAIGQVINAVLMEAVEKATIEKFRSDDEAALRSLITSAADKAKQSAPKESHEAIDSIVHVLMSKTDTDDEADLHKIESFSSEGLMESQERGDSVDDPAAGESPVMPPAASETLSQGDGSVHRSAVDDDEADDDQASDLLHRKAVRGTIAAVIVVAVLVALFFFVYRGGANLYFWKDDGGREVLRTAVPADTLALADSTAIKADTAVMADVRTPADRAAVNLPADSLDKAYVPDKPFYVIAAAVEFKRNAERALVDLRAQGYPAEYAGYRNGLYLVAYQGFYSRSQAMDLYRDIKEKTGNGDVWIKVYDRNADKKTD